MPGVLSGPARAGVAFEPRGGEPRSGAGAIGFAVLTLRVSWLAAMAAEVVLLARRPDPELAAAALAATVAAAVLLALAARHADPASGRRLARCGTLVGVLSVPLLLDAWLTASLFFVLELFLVGWRAGDEAMRPAPAPEPRFFRTGG